jgi:RHS repeat-associated protein
LGLAALIIAVGRNHAQGAEPGAPSSETAGNAAPSGAEQAGSGSPKVSEHAPDLAGAPPDSASEPEAKQPESADSTVAMTGKDAKAQIKKPDQNGPTKPPDPIDTLALPSGADKSGVTSKAISVPKGAGTIQGMEESFSAQLSTGIATFSVPLALPAARGGAQPSLGLSYSSSGGVGVTGVGWSIGVPFIARQTDRGVPRYGDQAQFHPEQDRFVFNGGQELVPICVVAAGLSCSGALASEAMPGWAAGWQYFRPRVEGSFLRFFWSPDHQTWRVQDKSGVTMELGVPLDGSGYANALERNPDKLSEVYRWHLVRQYDTFGSANPTSGSPAPANAVVFRYSQDAGMAYLSDIYDTPPAAGSALSSYAHHTRLAYEARPDPTRSYRSGWPIEQRLRLTRVDVASHVFTGGGPRRMVRRTHLAYDPTSHLSLLTSVQVEGRCGGSGSHGAVAESSAAPEGGEALPTTTNCPRLPAMTFGYSRVAAFTTSGAASSSTLAGYEGFDARLIPMQQTPNHSVDEGLIDLFDVNSDALPDVLVTAAGLYGSGHGVFFNGDGGVTNRFGSVVPMSVTGVIGGGPSTITLSNLNVAALDVDGDASINLLHMPKVKTYAVYEPALTAAGWTWRGREVTTASGQSPKIDFGKDTLDTQVMDVNFDGLVDVVVTTGTEVQTFFALGRYPGGDGQFGSAVHTGPNTASISNEPVRTCVPWSSTPVRFSDPDIKLADMNGDGITDIVRIRKGDIRYWPGRGNGFWGTGKRDDCPGGSFGSDRHIIMATSPQYSDIQGESLRIDDVNGDGLSDLVQVRFTDVDVWLNVDGQGWTERHVISGTPASPSYANRVRLVDINGSGTRDILWGNGGKYQYLDLQGGERPHVLTRVDNGLGKSTHLEYSTSTAEMLAAEAAADAWSSKMPTVAHVVKRVTETDNHAVAGKPAGTYVTEYSYRDPVFEGRQREFRGFKRASAKKIGDANSPTDISETEFLLGQCVDETAPGAGTDNGVDDCSVPERWRDNLREALKGLPYVTEKRDESGRVLATETMAYRLRKLYTGLDGREVRHAFETSKTSYLYDTDNFVAATQTVTLPRVQVERAPVADGSGAPPAASTADWTIENGSVTLKSTAGRARVQSSSQVDVFGNRTIAVAQGCTEGCPGGADETITTTTVPTRPTGDPTGWLWRTGQTYVQGSQHAATQWKETLTSYAPTGVPLTSTQKLSGSLPLDRFHAIGGTFAPPPADASSGADIVWETKYDLLGNVIKEFGPNGRCREVIYDAGFTQLPVEERMHKDDCTSPSLVTKVEQYDRGLALATDVRDMQGQPTVVSYDGFGRLVTLTRPHPDAAGIGSPEPSVIIEYFLPPDLGAAGSVFHSLIHTKTQDAAALSSALYLESWAYVDGFGRTLVTLQEADDLEDGAPWIASGQVAFDGKGTVERKHLESYYSGAPKAFPFGGVPSAPYGSQRYDAFGRQKFTTDLDGTLTLYSAYHALSTDMWDGADLEAGPHGGTFASETKDGHGRTAFTTERFHEGSTLRERITRTSYLPTNEPEVIKRELAGSTASVTRWMRYDSQARMVLNVEPNTSKGFTDDPTQLPSTLKAWRYAYNDAGDLVGTSDARGCGINFAYDGLGRLLTEDYSPCEAQHQVYSAPNATARTGVEVLYHYDSVPSDAPANGQIANFALGRLVAVYDRASFTVTKFDGRGRSTESAVRVAKPGAPDNALAQRFAPTWYQQAMEFDSADREVLATNGTTTAELGGGNVGGSTRAVTTNYSKRGTVKSVQGSYGTLVAKVQRAADGLLDSVQYGDVAETKTDYVYDTRRRVSTVQTYRGPPEEWTAPTPPYSPAPIFDSSHQPSFQLLLQDDEIRYDVVSNPTEVRDWRIADEWPEGAKPVTKKAEYDDLYRVKRVDYQYSDGDDVWKSPFEAENSGNPALQDSRRAKPSPHVAFDKRVLSQTYSYDWLGNTSASDDDAHGFYDRSLGTIGNGPTGGAAPKPYQLTGADNLAKPGTRTGRLAARYDDTGNLLRLAVDRGGPCLPSGSACNQLFAYEWDEVGRLTRARRWDTSSSAVASIDNTLPGASADADLSNAYDAGDQRVIKTARDSAGAERHSVYIFASLELRRAEWKITPPIDEFDYEVSAATEVGYLFANGVRLARLVYEPTEHDVPTLNGGPRLHVFFELGDNLGSASVVLDQATGELVERTTFEAYGSTESDYRPERWSAFREDYKFTGKEEDVTVGLHYFGKRFLSTHLNRWVSADPLAVHVPGQADLNLYAYVSGQTLQAVDPLGLDSGLCTGPGGCSGGQTPGQPAEPPKLAAAVYSGALAASGISPWMSAAFDRAMVEVARSATPEDRREIAQGLLAASATMAAAGLAASEGGPSTGARVGSAVGPEGTVFGVVLGTAGGLSLGMQLRVSAGLTATAGATVYAMGTTPPSDPKFAGANPSRDQTGLKDHARRHSDKSPSEYLKQGQQNIKEGKMLKAGGRDAEARYWVRRVGKNEYSVTITNKKNTIKSIDTWRNRNPKTDQLNKLTKQHVMKGLEKSGVTPPKGFWDSL